MDVAREVTVQAGVDQDSFTEWLRPHWTAMARLARRLVDGNEAEDALQDAVTLAWRRWELFDPARGSAQSWLLALVADQARRRRRSSKPVPVPIDETHPVREPTRPDPDVRRAVTSLSERQRLAVELYYYLGLPVSEVAEAMGCAPGTVKSTLADARSKLRSRLGEDFR